MHLMLFILS